ncbi:MAG: rod shape-determining protein MreD [Elusimicrobia bacterium]|nr:rod shape-determining protein MreD [Elusimicrobiota bacterium]
MIRIPLLLITGFIAQLVIFNYLSPSGLGINFTLLIAIQIALIRGSYTGELFGFFSGLIEDIFSLGVIGERALVRALIGFLAGRFKGKFAVQNIFFQIFLVFFIFAFYNISIYFIRAIFYYSPFPLKRILLISALNSIIAPLVYHLVKKASAR